MILAEFVVWCSIVGVSFSKNEESKFSEEQISPDGCYLDIMMNPTNCKDKYENIVKIDGKYEIAHNTYCALENGKDMFSILCLDGILFISSNEDENSKRIKREETSLTTENAGKFGVFTLAGAIVGSHFGSLGGIIGAGVGFLVDIFCLFLCNTKSGPPPNKPPTFARPAVLTNGPTIFAEEGKTTAIVEWVSPTIRDNEDGNIRVTTIPESYKSGLEYPEGIHTVFFVGTDSGGLSATAYIKFQVKLYRCSYPKWPEHGNIGCDRIDIIYGTTCKINCYSGYTQDEENNSSLQCFKSGEWRPPHSPNCKPQDCLTQPTIANGDVRCHNNEKVFGNLCEVVCNDGYQVNGERIVGCDINGMWGTMPLCKDMQAPRFYEGECPHDIQVYIDSANNTAKVNWDEPQGEDNSGEAVIITEIHGYKPGDRFDAGSHTIKYTIKDKEQNRGDSCVFIIQVLTLSCSPPNLSVAGGNHLKYNCPSYKFGAECTMACMSGYPMGGVNKIRCLADTTSNPPKLDWKWEDGELAPFCKETNCSRDELNEPVNGALACSQWTHGQMCQMQCGDGYDIPNIGDGLFVCGRSTGLWRPHSKVPNCDKRLDVNNMNLPSEFYYYTDKCNSSVQNLNEIKNNFIQALNSSKFLEECVGVPDCQAKFVDVTCGPLSSRRKRDFGSHEFRRSVSTLAYILVFELILPYIPVNGKSSDDIFAENEDRFNRMSEIIQIEVETGHFDLQIGDLRLDSDSFGPGIPSMVCPPGTFPRKESASCVGCPKGNYAKENGRCEECPKGTYQNKTNSLECEACPHNTNTTETGAENISQCLEYCAAGEFSSNMLTPCTKCPFNSFQPNPKSINCTRCAINTRSVTDGATSGTQCQEYDVQLSQNKAKLENNLTCDVISLFMWIYITNNQTDSAIEIENSGSQQNFVFKFTPTVSFEQSKNIVRTGLTLQTSIWTSVALIIDKMSSEVTMYINGNLTYTNLAFNVSKRHVLENADFIGMYGDIKISSFSVISKRALPSEVSSWASTCSPLISATIYSMDDLAETGSVRIVFPSACDAINECKSSPCGRHRCINKRGDFQCLCYGGFFGKQCQNPPDYCKDNNCQNGGTCKNGTGNYTCDCPYGYRGDICEIKAVDGDWSEWTNWTRCSKSCNGGIATRSRRCDNPVPHPEGKQCQGNSTETISCNEKTECPECTKLRRAYGLIIYCNNTLELQRCSIKCRSGLYFTNPPLPYYECGLVTGYKWNHQSEKNPSGRLPSCSELSPPLEMGMNFEGTYDSIPCTESNKKTVKDSISINLSNLYCKKRGNCEMSIQEPVCTSSGEKKSTEHSLTVSVGFYASIKTTRNSFDLTGLLGNTTEPSKELIDFVNQTLELEMSAQTLMNNSDDYFDITVAGTNHSLASNSSQLIYKSDIRCPSGTVRLEVFCALSPAGSYSDGLMITMCPRGQYQDTKGQSSCKKCPTGKTTVGIGSIHVSECFIDVHSGSMDKKDDDNIFIMIGVSVSMTIFLLIVAAVGALFACKRLNMKRSDVSDRSFDLNIAGEFHTPSKTVNDSKAFSVHY